jgi:hypothetical protein
MGVAAGCRSQHGNDAAGGAARVDAEVTGGGVEEYVIQKYWPGVKSTSWPSRSKTTRSVPFATSRFSLICARTPPTVALSWAQAESRVLL